MTASVALGLVFSLVCAIVAILGFLFKQRGAAGAPPVQWRAPIRSTIALFANKWWTLGILVALTGWFFHVAALALAPISLVQATIAGGLSLLTVLANTLFGFHIRKREWIGVALTAIGLAALAATMGTTGKDAHSTYAVAQMWLYTGVLVLGSFACLVIVRSDPPHAGPVIAVSAGLLWGASDICIKAATGHLDELGRMVPLIIAIILLSLWGLVVSARSLQLGPTVPVIAITSAVANVVAIASGPILFGEPMPDQPVATVIRILAFALVVVAAALTPGPHDPNAPADGKRRDKPATARA